MRWLDLLASATRLNEIVEGVMGERWSANGRRLVDTKEWCEFYVKLKRAQNPEYPMENKIVLIDRNGKECARLPKPPENAPMNNPHGPIGSGWIYHEGKWFGFGVGKLGGECHYYEV